MFEPFHKTTLSATVKQQGMTFTHFVIAFTFDAVFCRQANTWQQQTAEASATLQQQKQSHQQTLTLLDQAHVAQLSQLQSQLQSQATQHSAAESKLRAQLAEQSKLAQHLQHAMKQHDQQKFQDLQKKHAEDHALLKMILKKQHATEDEAVAKAQPVEDAIANVAMSSQQGEERQEQSASDKAQNDKVNDANAVADAASQQRSGSPFAAASLSTSERTLALEAELLRKEARILKGSLARAEAAVQNLTQAQLKDQAQSSAKLAELQSTLEQLEGKHCGSSALLDQTVAAMQSRTSILLQQRVSGMTLDSD